MINSEVKKMENYKKWTTFVNGKIGDIITGPSDGDPNKEFPDRVWEEIPIDFGGRSGDDLAWFDETMHRIQDEVLVAQGKRIDNRGRVYNIKDMSSRLIYHLDEEPYENETKEAPLENEPYQFFDIKTKHWVIDTEEKAAAEKMKKIAEKQAAIDDTMRQIQLSLVAKLAGTASENDEKDFQELSGKIEKLREEKRQLLSA